jgi:mono/diheme cytochrome c family protein
LSGPGRQARQLLLYNWAVPMARWHWFVAGAASLCLAELLAGWGVLKSASGFSARQQPTPAEHWVAHQAWAEALPADARLRANPVPNTPEVLTEARAHWADHCASCHGNDGSGDTVMGKNLYPPPPDMRRDETQRRSDGELFYIIQNGIRLTGMPAWGTPGQDDADSWKLVYFIRHLPALTFEERKEMEKLNPKTPEDREEEEQEEKFLQGEDTNAPETEHHHHH